MKRKPRYEYCSLVWFGKYKAIVYESFFNGSFNEYTYRFSYEVNGEWVDCPVMTPESSFRLRY
mgnify:CR=1 FL=1